MLSTLTLITILAAPSCADETQHPLSEIARATEMTSQSPIDLPLHEWDRLAAGLNVKLSHQPFLPAVEDTGHGFKIPAPEDAKPALWIEGVGDFKLVQLHFHIPSEHRLVETGKDEPHRPIAEIHFVHASADGELAVVGVFVEVDESDSAEPLHEFDALSDLLIKGSTERMLAPLDVIPQGDLFHYRGSLTTSPYTEGLYWFVAPEPVKINKSQLALLQPAQLQDLQRAAGKARDPQALNGREVTKSAQAR